MAKKKIPPLSQSGRDITPQEVVDIQEMLDMFWRLSRTELAQTICENMGWFSASGKNKADACIKLLEKLEKQGVINLPEKHFTLKSGHENAVEITDITVPPPEDIKCRLKELGKIYIEVVKNKNDADLWKEYIMRYHYLGYKKPFGCYIRYFIKSELGILGCILFSGSSMNIGEREEWIGWTEKQRLRNHGWVINNSRFLIFPWVKVPYLASYVLSLIEKQIAQDWEERWEYRPVLMETFVDPEKFRGTCYKAANWECIGMTSGEGLVRKGKKYITSPKKIFVRPLVKNFRDILCSGEIAGW